MKNRNIIYFSKSKALKILERPIQADLRTFLSATFAVTRNRVVKGHIQKTLHDLSLSSYKMSA